MNMRGFLIAGVFLLMAAGGAVAQRQPVLPQIDLPHSYYYREMYLPQLTSGPGSVAWSPDSREVVYSMAGSLWRQRTDSRTAQQITAGAGYDYQPDWSPDGRAVVYCSYQKDAVELWLVDLETGRTRQLTRGGAVNVEPRWSPDGKRIAFVSTAYHKRFHIFAGEVTAGGLANVTRLTGETRSPLPRYYYSEFDHELSPVWTPDGTEIVYVSNRGRIHGTGGLWRMQAQPGAEPREIHYEETNWKARPEISPDGTRIVFSSYLGRSWHQLWVMPAAGGDVFPVSYGEWDETGVRWSRDGKQLAFISNRNGETELWLQQLPGGAQRKLAIAERRYLRPMARLHIRLRDRSGRPLPARVSVTGADGRAYAPEHAWMHADDGFNRAERPFEAHYFHTRGEDALDVPPGKIEIEVMKGFEYRIERQTLTAAAGETAVFEKTLEPFVSLENGAERWVSSDLHVHMNYAGTYRNSPGRLAEQAEAENVGIVQNLIVNKEQRFPDIAWDGQGTDPASTPQALVVHGQEFHTSYWGHLGLLGRKGRTLLPGYAGYPNTAAASLAPTNAEIAGLTHAEGGLAGYVHPFEEEPQPLATPAQVIKNELPVDVALGQVDYLEVAGFSDHRSTAAVWYRLLNLGFRIPAGGGTDAMADYASLHGPVGLLRAYALVPAGPLNEEAWLGALKKGRTFATNGPILEFTLGGQPLGGEVALGAPGPAPFTAKMRSIVPVDHAEIVCNGRVVKTLALNAARDAAESSGTLPLETSGWCVLRAWSEAAVHPVLDNYVYATTSPVYVSVAGKPPHSPEDAAYFSAWIDRVTEAASAYPDWNSPAEKAAVLGQLAAAKAVFEKLRQP